MPTSQILELAFGLALGLGGLALIRRAWFNRHGRHAAAMGLGWAMILIAAFPLAAALGGDRGVTTAVLQPMLIALGMLTPGLSQPVSAPATGPALTAPGRGTAVLRTLGVIALCGPVALFAAVLAVMTLFQLSLRLGVSDPDALFLALIAQPLIWAGLAVLGALDAPLRWRAAGMAGFTLLFAASAALLTLV